MSREDSRFNDRWCDKTSYTKPDKDSWWRGEVPSKPDKDSWWREATKNKNKRARG